MEARAGAGAGSPGARGRALRVAALAALLAAGFGWLIAPQWADPFARHDDYLAIFPRPELYWWKTLAKGRWLTWAWTLRPWPTAPQTLFALQMALWCVAAAATSAGLFRDDRRPWRAALGAAALAAMPQAADISVWFAATLPATATVAATALLACLAPARWTLRALPLLVALALLAHSSYPLMVLMVAALAADWRTVPRAWALLPAAWLAGLALGVALILGLNSAVHGTAAVEAERWTEPVTGGPAAASLGSLGRALALMAAGQAPLGLILAAFGAAGLALAVRTEPRRATPVLAAALLALALGIAPVAAGGVAVPFRATGHLWLAVVGGLLLGLRVSARPALAVPPLAGLAVATLAGALLWHAVHARTHLAYQALTRELAGRAEAAADGSGAPLRRIVAVGQVAALREAAPLQFSIGLAFRLEQLTGAPVALCSSQAADTEALGKGAATGFAEEHRGWADELADNTAACVRWAELAARLPALPAAGSVAALGPGVVGLRLPDGQEKSIATPFFSQSP